MKQWSARLFLPHGDGDLTVSSHPRSMATLELLKRAGLLEGKSKLVDLSGLSEPLPLGYVASVGPELQGFASSFSRLMGRKHLHASQLSSLFSAIRGEMSSLTLFINLQKLTPAVVRSILEWADANVPVGIVTGVSEIDVENWIVRRCLRSLLYSDHSGVTALVRSSIPFDELSSSVRVLDESISLTDEFFQRSHEAVIHELHSRETCARWANQVLCGLGPDGADVTSPGCRGGKSCFWTDRKRNQVGSLDSAHHVAVSCGTLRLENHQMDPRAGLGLTLWAGTARSLLSPYRFITADDWLAPFLTELLLSGLPLGVAAVEGNRILTQSETDRPALVLLGDPEDCLNLESLSLPVYKSTQVREAQAEPDSITPFNPKVSPSPLTQQWILEQSMSKSSTPDLSTVAELAFQDTLDGMWLTLRYQRFKSRGRVVGDIQCNCCRGPATIHESIVANMQVRRIDICDRCGITADYDMSSKHRLEYKVESGTSGRVLSHIRIVPHLKIEHAVLVLSVQHARRWGWSDFPILLHHGPVYEEHEWNVNRIAPATFPSFAVNVRVIGLLDGVAWFESRPWICTWN